MRLAGEKLVLVHMEVKLKFPKQLPLHLAAPNTPNLKVPRAKLSDGKYKKISHTLP